MEESARRSSARSITAGPPADEIYHSTCFAHPEGVTEKRCDELTCVPRNNREKCCTIMDEGTPGCKSGRRVCYVCLLRGRPTLVTDFKAGLCKAHAGFCITCLLQGPDDEAERVTDPSGLCLFHKEHGPDKLKPRVGGRTLPPVVDKTRILHDPISFVRPAAPPAEEKLLVEAEPKPKRILPEWDALISRYRKSRARAGDISAPSVLDVSDVVKAMEDSGIGPKEICDKFLTSPIQVIRVQEATKKKWFSQMIALRGFSRNSRTYLKELRLEKAPIDDLIKVARLPPKGQVAAIKALATRLKAVRAGKSRK